MKAEDYKSGITGRAEVRFGGKVKFTGITVKGMPIHGIALSEWFNKGELGTQMSDEELAYDTQVTILFNDLKSVDIFRMVLDGVEAQFKEDNERKEAQ